MIRAIFFLAFLFVNHLSPALAAVDLERRAQDIVLSCDRIHIPRHPHAFNPSIVRWKGRLLLSFREIRPSYKLSPWPFEFLAESRLGVVWLDEQTHQPISKAQILQLYEDGDSAQVSRSEDARLIVVGEKLYIVYSDNRDVIFSDGGFRIHIGELYDDDTGHFWITSSQQLTYFENESPFRREKNWVPFDFQDNLLLAYSLVPHRIFLPRLGSEACDTIATTDTEVTWRWGELRGGTPAVQIDPDHYLAFFHSSIDLSTVHSQNQKSLHYFMGAYLFSSHLPFKITHISPEPIISRGFYSGAQYQPYWKPVQVIFPGGLLIEDQFLWVAYGRQDHEVWIAKIDRKTLLDSLRSLNTKEKGERDLISSTLKSGSEK